MRHVLPLFLLAAAATATSADRGGISMFDGSTLSGWKSNDETAGAFCVEDGALKVAGGRAHLFYIGLDDAAAFTNFEFHCRVRAAPGANSGIYFHTAFQEKGWPAKGYECQVNNTHKDPKKIGGLYGIADILNDAPARDGERFDCHIRFECRRIVFSINGKVTTDWAEPAEGPPINMPGRRLGAGTIAIQGRETKSTIWYCRLESRPLPPM